LTFSLDVDIFYFLFEAFKKYGNVKPQTRNNLTNKKGGSPANGKPPFQSLVVLIFTQAFHHLPQGANVRDGGKNDVVLKSYLC
jgi:hypothetical protein